MTFGWILQNLCRPANKQITNFTPSAFHTCLVRLDMKIKTLKYTKIHRTHKLHAHSFTSLPLSSTDLTDCERPKWKTFFSSFFLWSLLSFLFYQGFGNRSPSTFTVALGKGSFGIFGKITQLSEVSEVFCVNDTRTDVLRGFQPDRGHEPSPPDSVFVAVVA